MAQFQNVWGKTSLAKDRDKALGCLRRMTKLETYIIYVIKDEDHQDDNHDHDVQDDQDHKENHSDNRGYKIDTDADHDENSIDTGEDTDIRTDTDQDDCINHAQAYSW